MTVWSSTIRIKRKKLKNNFTVSTFLKINKLNLGMRILRWDFSDPQGGKGIYDRRGAHIKSQIRYMVNAGCNCITAEDFLNIASNCEIYDTTIILSKQLTQPDSVYVAIDNISIYNKFIFTERGVVYKDITKLVVANFSLWLISK